MDFNYIHLWQIQIEPWRPDLNIEKATQFVKNAKKRSIVIFPELFISGYMIWDDFLNDDFVKQCNEKNDVLVQLSKKYQLTIIWWNVDFLETKKNEDWTMRKYNAVYLASEWKILKKQYKTLLPNYRMFDDKRYFTSLERVAFEEWKNIEDYYCPVKVLLNNKKIKISLLICEDIWNTKEKYHIDPVKLTKTHKPDLIIVPSASPFFVDKFKVIDKLLQTQSKNTSIAYVNPIWIQNNWKNIFCFNWFSAIYKDSIFIKWAEDYKENIEIKKIKDKDKIEKIYDTLVYTTKHFFKQIWIKKALIGLSWWIDSWVSATTLTIALWKKNVISVNMPSKYNSNTTKNLAEKLANNLQIQYIISPIQESVDLTIKTIETTTWIILSDFEIENIQARERWKRLSDLAPIFDAVYTNNWNKDEFLTWYATLYWDINWSIALIWDLTKTEVIELALFINKKFKKELIPKQMIDLKPTAELNNKQNSDNWWWDPFNYKFLWRINDAFIVKQKSLMDLLILLHENKLESFLWLEKDELNLYFSSKKDIIDELEKIWKLKKQSVFKRIQCPPIIAMSKRSFWYDYRESQKILFLWFWYEELKKKIINP